MGGTPRSNESGATSVEYALMLSLILFVIVSSVGMIGASLSTFFAAVAALI